MDPLLGNLQKQVTCSICLDTYTEPKTISCLHTFCCKCLERHATVSQKQGKYRCPECQAKIELPEGNRFDRLPTSFFHLSLLDVFETGDREAVQRLQQEICSQHKEERVRYYCFSCKASICPVCFAEEHRGHEFDVFEKVEEENKKYVMSNVQTMKAEANLCKAEIGQFEKTFQDVETAIAIAKQEVSEAAEQVITKVREQEKQLMESLEMTRTKKTERINLAKKEVETLMKQMIQAAEFGETLVQGSSTADIIHNKEALRQKFEELRGVEVPKQRQTTFIKFTAASQHNFNLGSIQVSENLTNAAPTLEGLDQAFQADVQEELTLCPKPSGGEMNVQAVLKDQVKVLMNPAKNATNVIDDEKGNGNLNMMLTQKVSGACNTEVNMDGDKLPTCPMTVPVKKRELVVVGELNLKPFPGSKLGGICGIAVNTKGEIVVTDNYGHCVHVFDKNGNCLRKIGSRGNHKEQFQYPVGISFISDSEVLVADQGNKRIQRLNIQTGTFMKCFGKDGRGKGGEFDNPADVAVDDEGRIVVTEWGNDRIQAMSKEGESILKFGSKKLDGPTCCLPYKDLFFVSDGGSHCVKVFNQTGKFLYKIGKRGKQDGHFRMPYGLLVDSSENLLVCDYDNDRVQQFSLDGHFLSKSATRLSTPIAITTTPDGMILVTSDSKKVYIIKENFA